MAVIRQYDPSRDYESVRACFVELQEVERELDSRMPAGEDIADDYLKLLFARCVEFAGVLLVAQVDGQLVGYVAVLTQHRSHEPDDSDQVHGFITDLVVSGPHRGRSIGRALLHAAEARVRLSGVESLRLSVKAGNTAAEGLYAAEGFVPSIIELEKVLVDASG